MVATGNNPNGNWKIESGLALEKTVTDCAKHLAWRCSQPET
jgi:hypothetical protein